MPQLAFFPWLRIQENLEVGPYRLLCYERGGQPANGPLQIQIDNVIQPYRDLTGDPIHYATILTTADRGVTDDMPGELISELFEFSELVATVALSARRFFENYGYCNRDNVRLVIQGFREDSGGALVRTRRRDGSISTYITAGVNEVRCPPHIRLNRIALDVSLLNALHGAQGQINERTWGQLFQAAVLFNEANTDRDYMPETVELVLAFASLEQLLDRSGHPREAAEAFSAIWMPAHPIPRDQWTIQPITDSIRRRFEQAPCLRYAWLEDMGVARGSVAHGHGIHAYQAAWSVPEHLLLAAFVIPRLLKLRLAQIGHYTFTGDDQGDVNVLEALLNERHLEPRDPSDQTPFPWLRVLLDAMVHDLFS
ncbi:MAG: hypothetical protein FJ123_11735 [Deltaproteobacteria bacterium]|nr:hypothetical protein [Deltaproteobacteria bacterium]